MLTHSCKKDNIYDILALMNKMKTLTQFRKESFKNAKVIKAYNDLSLEYKLISAIIEQRIRKGVTQKKLAEKMGTKQSAIARFESGNANPTLEFIGKLSSALDLTLSVHR